MSIFNSTIFENFPHGAFAQLYEALDQTTSTNHKVSAMVAYFASVPALEAAWAVFFLSGQRLKRFIAPSLLRSWGMDATQTPPWLYEYAYAAVGDTAETVALLMAPYRIESRLEDMDMGAWMQERLLPLTQLTPTEQYECINHWWQTLPLRECFILNKLLMGNLRVGVSQNLLVRALAKLSDIPATTIAHRLMGTWQPTVAFYETLISTEHHDHAVSQPYPFFLASPLEQDISTLGDIHDWFIEWKWDGIRAQLIHRDNEVFLWSRGEDLITERFPEVVSAASCLPNGTVLDGEILAFENDQPLPFSVLQTRIGRKQMSKSVLAKAPVVFMAYDILEYGGEDYRSRPHQERRALLESMIDQRSFRLSPLLLANSWEEASKQRELSRERFVEGFILKRKNAPYQTGRKHGDWWKWKIDPYTLDAVLTTAQVGTGRRANLYTDYTFAIYKPNEDDTPQLVPIAKAYSGLSDAEILELDKWIRQNTLEKFGPVRSVLPQQVFELAFEGIAVSKRHKSGFALRFPRILRWRHDKPVSDIDTTETLARLQTNG